MLATPGYWSKFAPHMEFTAVILFLILYFVRFHDWVPGMQGLNVIKPVIALGIWGLLTRERRSPAWRFMSTPHEWVMMAYLAHGLWVDPDWVETIQILIPYLGYYVLTSQALNSEERVDKFFSWWAGCVALMCLLGVLTSMGIDITKARDLIDDKGGRLCLNTWLLDNPNALGHTAVTVYPLIFFTMMFRRGLGGKLLAVPLLIVVTQCVVATESKGAYLSAAAAISAALLVGRSKLVQLVVLAGLIFAGSTVTSMLPRMIDKEHLRYDEGVMGRAMAFKAGRDAYETDPYGWNKFQASFEWEGATVDLSTHSSIVQVGADQGAIGLFLWLSILALSARSVFQFKPESDELERVRRLLFALIVGYFVSGWMINRSYHAEFFLLAGAAVSYHKLARESIRRAAGVLEKDEDEDDEPAPALTIEPDAGGGAVITQTSFVAPWKKLWNRYGILDFAIAYLVLWFVEWLWTYIIDYFISE